MNVKGSIDTTATWVVAIILILIILAFFLISINYIKIGDEKNQAVLNNKRNLADFSSTSKLYLVLKDNYQPISEWADQEFLGVDRKKYGLAGKIRNYIDENDLDMDITLIKERGKEVDVEIIIGDYLENPDHFGYLDGVGHFKVLTEGGSFVDVYYR